MQPQPPSTSIPYTTAIGVNVPTLETPRHVSVPENATIDELLAAVVAAEGRALQIHQRHRRYDNTLLVLRSERPLTKPVFRALGDHHSYHRLRIPNELADNLDYKHERAA